MVGNECEHETLSGWDFDEGIARRWGRISTLWRYTDGPCLKSVILHISGS
jgi:hypothetical protein